MSQRELMPPPGNGPHPVVASVFLPFTLMCKVSQSLNIQGFFFLLEAVNRVLTILFSRDLKNLGILNGARLCH